MEIGLGAREWTSHLETISETAEVSEHEIENMIIKIHEMFPQDDSNSNSDNDSNNNNNNNNACDSDGDVGGGSGLLRQQERDADKEQQAMVIKKKAEEQALVEFKASGVVEYYQNRNFKGLIPTIHQGDSRTGVVDSARSAGGSDVTRNEPNVDGHEDDADARNLQGEVSIFKIHQGQFGVAAGYTRNATECTTSVAQPIRNTAPELEK